MSGTGSGLAIMFGTDGWRGRIGDDYTYENVRRCAQGVAEWARAAGTDQKGVVIAYDRRFASELFAQAAAEVLLTYDIPVAMAETAVPTQMTWRRRPCPPR
jgi:phosphomannomutase